MSISGTNTILLFIIAILITLFGCDGEIYGKYPRTSIPGRYGSSYSEYSINSVRSTKDATQPTETAKAMTAEREQLYEAYNLLHTLAQDFHKPFDAPAVIVVGHQTSGKSALIEALMGFQFNQVGGGTKTRRPIALRMQYNPNCLSPMCFLTMENGKEEHKSLQEIQEYIESENKRLERDATRSFDPREINIRMEYKYCPNMIVIDTPGLIHPPKGRSLTSQQRALQQASREAEELILAKIKCPDYIILCVEDTTDWKHATTRNLVMQADPHLARTVLVTTKLDTKLPQFSESHDLHDFLAAPLINSLFSQLLGGPFYTSVPSGRIGNVFATNEDFVHALKQSEKYDRAYITHKIGKSNNKEVIQHVGVSKLRQFLEARIEESYRRNVAKIVPLLQSESKTATVQLASVEKELENLSIEKLKESANLYREKFVKELANVLQGTIRVSPEEHGETLETETMKGGSFLTQDLVKSEAYQQILIREVGNHFHKLFGGAQYHRTMKEFAIAVRHGQTPKVSEDEIANAAGIADTHSGVNFMRAACIIAMEKAHLSFEPMLEALRHRIEHVMKRSFPIIEKLVFQFSYPSSSSPSSRSPPPLSNSFRNILQSIYFQFIEETLDETMRKCRDDLFGMTKFVTWDVEDKSGTSTLYRLLPTPSKMAEIYNMALDKKKTNKRNSLQYDDDLEEMDEVEEGSVSRRRSGNVDKVMEEWTQANTRGLLFKSRTPTTSSKPNNNHISNTNKPVSKPNKRVSSLAVSPVTGETVVGEEGAELSDYYRVMQLTEEMLSGASASRTSALVTSLVQYIISSWRNHFAKTTAMKFNCFFIIPFIDNFPAYLRNELDKIYDNKLSDIFDIMESRKSLLLLRANLLAECEASSKLQQRFDSIAAQLSGNKSGNDDKEVVDDDEDDDFSDEFGHHPSLNIDEKKK